MKNPLSIRTIRIINATIQVVIGLVGVLANVVQHLHGQPLDVSTIACFFGVALSGHNTLTGVGGITGGPLV